VGGELMRVLVLGGTRFIGAHAVRRLAADGHEIAVFHRGETEAGLPAGVAHLHGPRERLAEFVPRFRDFRPEVVLDVRALTERDGATLVALFRGIARRLVVISSGDVYRAFDRFRRADPGPPDPVPLTEDSPLRDRMYPYRETGGRPGEGLADYDKILVERAAMSAPDLPATILRLPMVYGPGDYQHRLFEYLKRMDDGRRVILVSGGMARWRCFRAYVEDVASAIALGVTDDRAAGRIYHVGDADNATEEAWIRRIAVAAGWTGEVSVRSVEALPGHLRPDVDPAQDLALDSSRIRRELGYREIVAPDEAMRRTVAWERENPPPRVNAADFNYDAEDAAISGGAGLTRGAAGDSFGP
jgi:nucleoside-diphosphate-sugar epimerase